MRCACLQFANRLVISGAMRRFFHRGSCCCPFHNPIFPSATRPDLARLHVVAMLADFANPCGVRQAAEFFADFPVIHAIASQQILTNAVALAAVFKGIRLVFLCVLLHNLVLHIEMPFIIGLPTLPRGLFRDKIEFPHNKLSRSKNMRKLLINYDLNSSGQNYSVLTQSIKQLGLAPIQSIF